jgi:hypothetical protein
MVRRWRRDEECRVRVRMVGVRMVVVMVSMLLGERRDLAMLHRWEGSRRHSRGGSRAGITPLRL